jgi:hypothetical protein
MVPVGALLGGFIGEALGLRAALLVGAVGIACAPLWVVFSPVPRIRRLDDVAAVADLGLQAPPSDVSGLPAPSETA